ncbi:MAG TPA: hypothetical protein VKB86_00630 [Pyrinomonadaceae bacterium]|nr:hypothetical protein [Pyrinomonadaceae bacterium]
MRDTEKASASVILAVEDGDQSKARACRPKAATLGNSSERTVELSKIATDAIESNVCRPLARA